MITWNHDIEKELELLNKYFRTTTFEKHPKAMMGLLLDEVFDKVMGKNFAKQRISKRKMARFQEELKLALQSRYGKFMNICLHKSSRPHAIKFDTNFHHAYKTEFGILYGAPTRFDCGRTFFTSHCFQRFEERCDPELHKHIAKIFSEKSKYVPTAADLVMFLTSVHDMEYAKKDKFYFLNIGVGFLVLEDYNDFFVAKTFMTAEMLDPSLEWYTPTLDPSISHDTLKSALEHDPVRIERPKFFTDWLQDQKEP
jgi:hypothetical protein